MGRHHMAAISNERAWNTGGASLEFSAEKRVERLGGETNFRPVLVAMVFFGYVWMGTLCLTISVEESVAGLRGNFASRHLEIATHNGV